MKTQKILGPAKTDRFESTDFSVHSGCCSQPSGQETTAFLLVSDDVSLSQNLRRVANQQGRMVVRADGTLATVLLARAIRPAAVLIDLDSLGEAARETADSLLKEQSCPPVILLTSYHDAFHASAGPGIGSVLDRSASPGRLLELVDFLLAAPDSAQAHRRVIQQVAIRFLKPSRWSVPLTPGNRFWGINE